MISKELRQNMKLGNGIRQAYHEAKRQREVYGAEKVFDLSIGNPLAPAPEKVKEVMKDLAETVKIDHRYMCEAGYEEVREKIANSLNDEYQTSYSFENIIMTNGVAGGINIVLKALLDPGDEVLIFKPYYPAYIGFIKNYFGKVVTVGSKGSDFQPDMEEFEEKITEKTKVVIVNSPHNPSGTLYTLETAKKIGAILKKKQKKYGHDICLLSDEPYRELVYDGTTLPWWPKFYHNSVVCYSYSKSLSLAGERIGYVLIPPEFADCSEVISAIRMSVGRLGFVNAPAFFQRVIGQCMEVKVDLEYYDRARRLLYKELRRLGFECAEPKGAFYVFVKVPGVGEETFLKMARERHLIFVGGSAFGVRDYVRMSFCCGVEVIERAIPALELLAKDCGLF